MAAEWHETQVTMLRKLWSEGYSCSQIANEIGGGLTRNAIIGKVHRLGLESRKTGRITQFKAPRAPRAPQPRKPRFAYSVLPEGIEPAKVELREALEATPLHIDLGALNSSNCHWPYGDGPFTFCGCQALPEKPYCHAHDHIAHGNGTSSERFATKTRVAA